MKRKDALWVMQMCRDRDARSEAEREAFDTAIEALKSESIFTADRPRGEWIHTPNGIDRDFVWWVCSECGHKIFSETEKDRIEFHAYCGRCGAYMRGDTERC